MKRFVQQILQAGAVFVAVISVSGATLKFDGVDDQIVVGVQTDLKMTNAFTLEAWVLPTRPISAADTRDVILGREGEYLLARAGNGEIYYAKATPASAFVWRTTGYVAPTQQWVHLALTFDGTVVRCFADGAQVFSETASGTLGDANVSQNEFRIGGRQAAAQFFQGQLDEIRVWNVARSPAALAGARNRPLTGQESGLTAYYRFNEGSGGVVLDSAEHGLTGTFFGGVLWNALDDAIAHPVAITQPARAVSGTGAILAGRFDPKGAPGTNRLEWGAGSTAVEFDGSDDFVHVANGPDLAGRSFSIEFWARRDRSGVSEFPVSMGLSAANQLLHLGWRSANQMTFAFFMNDLNVAVNGEDSQWHHWAFTYDSSNRQRRVYQDGVLAGQDIASAHFIGTGPLRLGRYFANNAVNAFAGALDEVRIWNDTVLTPATIRQWMNAEITVSHPNHDELEAHWKLDEATGRTAFDSRGRGHDGRLVGDPVWVPGGRPVYDQGTAPQPAMGVNRVLNLDGVDDHVAVPSGTWFSESPFTIEGWVYVRGHQNDASLLDFANGPVADNVVLALSSATSGRFQLAVVKKSAAQSVQSPDPVPLNAWTHLAATWNNGLAALYMNGRRVASGPVHAPLAINRMSNFIGRGHDASDQYADALFDDIRVWNVALEGETIAQWMHEPNLAVHPEAGNLSAQWTFDESGGVVALDTRLRRDGTLAGGAGRLDSFVLERSVSGLSPGTLYHARVSGSNTNGAASGRNRRFATLHPGNGTALTFDGSDDAVRLRGLDQNVPTTEVTVEFWQRVHAVKAQSTFSLDLDLNANRFQAHVPWSNGSVYWDFGNISGSGRLTYTPPVSLVGAWHHFALVSSVAANYMRIYRNGVLEAQKTGAGIRAAGSFDLILGDAVFGGVRHPFDGDLDEFRIWNVARSEEEIRRDLNVRLSGTEANLVVYYPMDEGAGSILEDATGQGRYGRFEEGPAWSPSSAPVGIPIALTGPATDVGFGSATLTGTVQGEGTLPVDVWFEYGTRSEPVPGSARNRVSFFTSAGTLSSLAQVNFNAAPAFEQAFETIDFNPGTGALWPGAPLDNVAARFTGSLFLAASGSYTFYLLSDDGSQLYLNGALVINHDGPHAATERAATLYLPAGHHDLEVRYFEQTQVARILLSYSGPGLDKQVIPAEAFLVHQPVFSDQTPVTSIEAGVESSAVQDTASGLDGGVDYHYRLVASNANGAYYGAVRTFASLHPAALTALNFDGVNDRVVVDATTAQTHLRVTTQATWEAWIHPTGPGSFTDGSGIVLSKEGEYEIGWWPDGRIQYAINVSPLGWNWIDTGAIAPRHQWTHIALTYDGSQLRLYTNGVLAHTNAASGPLADFSPNANEFQIGGRQSANQFFQGMIDEVRVWNVARSETEIREDLSQRLSGLEEGLLAYYRFDEETGSMALDSGPNGAHGTLSGGPVYLVSGAPLFKPIVSTLTATPVLATQATLRGTVNPSGSNTVAYFEYGSTIAYGTQTESIPVGGGLAPLPFTAGVTNLEPGTTYHFRIVAFNDTGTVVGEDSTFTTLVLGCGWPIASKVTGGSAGQPKHVVDPEGNAYLAGYFSGNATFKSTLEPEGGAGTNAFVAKLARGADWLWSVNIPLSAGGAMTISSIAVDGARNVHVAGWFSGQATFGAHPLSAGADGDMFVAKLDSQGTNWLWARAAGSTQPDAAHSVAVTPSGDVFVAGYFAGTADFGTNTITSTGNSRDLLVAKLDADGQWLWAQTAEGDGANDAAMAMVLSNSGEAFVAGHFDGPSDFGLFHLEPDGGTDVFVARISGNGQWGQARRAGGLGADTATALAIDPANQLYLLGRFAGTADYADTVENLNVNLNGDTRLFVAKLNSDANMLWYAQAGAGSADSIAVDAFGRVYVSGEFSISTDFGDPKDFSLVSSGNTDVFLAQLDAESGVWGWGQKIGATGSERRGSVAVDAEGGIVLSGSFQNTVQIGFVLLTSPNERDIFVARLSPDRVFEHNTYVIGQPIPVPALAQDPNRDDGGAIAQPIVTILEREHADSDAINSFVWSPAENKLFPVRPVTAVLKWPLTTDVTNTTSVATCVARTIWPARPQYHVANAPVELEPALAGFPLRFLNLSFTTINGASVDPSTKSFQAPQVGWTVLQFLDTAGATPNPTIHPSLFEVVRTVNWNDPEHLDDNQMAIIGEPLTRAIHNDPTGANGFVYFERAFYDGAGDERAHNRSNREGPILPVNRDTAAADDDLVVVWYRLSSNSGIAWPDDPVRYLAQWPAAPDELVLASGAGSGVLDPFQYPSKLVYHQRDPALPGFNPNEEHAALYGDVLYALRNDLNALVGVSEPYTLLKHRNPATGAWMMKVYRIVSTTVTFPFAYTGEAGKELALPRPLSLLALCGESNQWVSGPGFKDHRGRLYARAAGPNNSGASIVARYFYPLQPQFYYDLDRDGQSDAPTGACLPWLDRRPGGSVGTPVDVVYQINWPTQVPTLQIGETLLGAKFGLPNVAGFARAEVIFDEGDPDGTNALDSLVRLFDPLAERTLQLRAPGDNDFLDAPGFSVLLVEDPGAVFSGVATANDAGRLVFPDLPYVLRSRLTYDPLNHNLAFRGLRDDNQRYGGPDNPLLLINVLSPRERDRIKALKNDPEFSTVIDALYDLTRNPNRLDLDGDEAPDRTLLIGLTEVELATGERLIVPETLGDGPKALTAGPGTGAGYVTLIENDDLSLGGLPVSLHVIRVQSGPFRGDIKVIASDNVFDEKLTLRHSGDFGGEPQRLEFEWYYKPVETDTDRTLLPTVLGNGTVDDPRGWIRYTAVPTGVNGFNDITLGDGNESSLLVLSDNYFICRYRGYVIGGATNWSDWVGAIGGGEAQLAEGWVKRVRDGLNPFEARTREFHENETVTFASMIRQAGTRYEGDIAFNSSGANLNSIGLIEAYETVLRRARRLSVDGVPPVNYQPANDALLLAAGFISDLYMLLGHEAAADAADPTIGFRTASAEYGTLAPSIFTFQNQLDSLLEEELALLRGRDNRSATVRNAPVYNRLFWNFTRDEGEVAYAQAYNVTDQNSDGVIDAGDARLMFPQGHGDAWGHYLTATKTYYRLLRNPYFAWIPRSEPILLSGVPVEVDYLDERKFARAAAAKAKTGAEIVDLTYRLNYVDDPAGQFQGYEDTDTDRAWGVSDWAHRSGSAAYLDWVTANAILPSVDPDPTHTGLTKIDRTTVAEIDEIIAGYESVQIQIDKADTGLNPLGLAKNVVPFDIDPTQIAAGRTHFEQIYERALGALNNTVTVFNHANQLSQALRALQDTVNDFSSNVQQRERDYKNRMIEIFGYPYAGDIGSGRTFPSGYDGPDLYHYMYVNTVELNGDTAPPSSTFTGYFTRLEDNFHFFQDDLPGLINTNLFTNEILPVAYPVSTAEYAFAAPASWGQRRAPGELQIALSELLQSEARMKQGLLNYDNLLKEIDDQIDLLESRYDVRADSVAIRDRAKRVTRTIAAAIGISKITRGVFKAVINRIQDTSDIVLEALPKVVGVATDPSFAIRGTVKTVSTTATKVLAVASGVLEIGEGVAEASIASIKDQALFDIQTEQYIFEVQQHLKEIEQLMRREAVLRAEGFALAEKVNQNLGRYQAALAKGLRLFEERVAFRQNAAAETQASRYQDMTFRIFRNDAIQKYRAQFDLAAQYVFLAAVAYDYETQLLGNRPGAGAAFLTDIVRQRALGEVINGLPTAGRHGLADPLARLSQNFAVLKGQLGFNNPQTETGRFSLRHELFRLSEESERAWRDELKRHIVPNLWDLPEFRRYCRPFAPENAGPQPGLVIRFPTTITFGLNYFGWPLGGGDNAYDSTLFATKVRSAGVWFEDYLGANLSQTPRVYLVPVGADVLRSPSGNNLDAREWRVVDQKIPVPFPIGFSSLNDFAWIPINDSLSDEFAGIRRFSSFRAYHDSGFFNPAETVNDTRLIGRSVWNTDWMLIIPGGTFLFDPNQGLETFVNSVSDIRIFFQTYAYSGN